MVPVSEIVDHWFFRRFRECHKRLYSRNHIRSSHCCTGYFIGNAFDSIRLFDVQTVLDVDSATKTGKRSYDTNGKQVSFMIKVYTTGLAFSIVPVAGTVKAPFPEMRVAE